MTTSITSSTSSVTSTAPSNAAAWFEIPTQNLAAAQAFYEAVLTRPMQREQMGPSEMAVFQYAEGTGTGGCVFCSPSALPAGQTGTLVYLDCMPSTLNDALARALKAGAKPAVPVTALPPGMGFFAALVDLGGNRIGLHSFAE